jgi:hypothetical protein
MTGMLWGADAVTAQTLPINMVFVNFRVEGPG